jgi:hypothetical protein
MFDSIQRVLEAPLPTAEKCRLMAAVERQAGAAKAQLYADLIAERTRAVVGPEPLNRARTVRFDDTRVDEDVVAEIALLEHTSTGAAHYLVRDLVRLRHRLPGTWAAATGAGVPLWQARQVAAASVDGNLDQAECLAVDQRVAPLVGQITGPRFRRALRAAVLAANPAKARRQQSYDPEGRFVRKHDLEGTGAAFIKARLDAADAIFLDAEVQRIAEHLAAAHGDWDIDRCRAKALGLLANPAAVIEQYGFASSRGLAHPPRTDAEAAAFRAAAAAIAPLLRPDVTLVIHAHLGHLGDDDALADVEDFGPCFLDQVKDLVGHAFVRVTPAVHIGYRDTPVDAYETPDRIREHVFIRDRYEAFPYSSRPARACDLDHITPYTPGGKNQTRPSNLAPLSRRVHRAKTHSGWTYHTTEPATYHWTTPAGHTYQHNPAGTQPTRAGP